MNKADELVEHVAIKLYNITMSRIPFTPHDIWDSLSNSEKDSFRDDARQILSHPDIVYIDENQEMPSIQNGKGEMKSALQYKKDLQDFKRVRRFE